MARSKAKPELVGEKLVRKHTTADMRKHGDFEHEYTKLDGQLHSVVRNRGGTTLERWLKAGDPFFEPQTRAIRSCQALWVVAEGKSSLVTVPGGAGKLWMGQSQQEALTELAGYENRLPRRAWRAFEKTARFDQSGEDAGSHMATNTRDAVKAAKEATAFCASMIAMWRGE